jgi:hypothetical protein
MSSQLPLDMDDLDDLDERRAAEYEQMSPLQRQQMEVERKRAEDQLYGQLEAFYSEFNPDKLEGEHYETELQEIVEYVLHLLCVAQPTLT